MKLIAGVSALKTRRGAGVGLLCVGAVALACQFVNAMAGDKGSHDVRGGVLHWIWFFVPYLTSLAGVYLCFGTRKSQANTEGAGPDLLKTIVAGSAASGGVYILALLLALALGSSAGVDALFENFLPIIIALTIVLSLTVMRRLR